MKRVEARIGPTDFETLKRIAAEQDVSMASLVRWAVSELLADESRVARLAAMMAHAGRYSSGLHDVSENHDKYLNEGKRW